MGITISKIMNTKSTLVDVNKRAVHLAKMNIKKNDVDAVAFESNIYSEVSDKYDVIITNPPIRAEKFSIQQGMLEMSNSNVIKEMINTINVTRNYESLQKHVKTSGQMLSQAISTGRLKF